MKYKEVGRLQDEIILRNRKSRVIKKSKSKPKSKRATKQKAKG